MSKYTTQLLTKQDNIEVAVWFNELHVSFAASQNLEVKETATIEDLDRLGALAGRAQEVHVL